MYEAYNPYGYQFPGQQSVPMQYAPVGINRQPQPPQQNGMPVVLQVSTIKQVEQAPVQPGGKVLVLVANEPVIAMRSADNMGLTTTDYYHIERFDPDASGAVPTGDFVTRAEFQQAIQSLAQQMQQAAPANVDKEVTKK